MKFLILASLILPPVHATFPVEASKSNHLDLRLTRTLPEKQLLADDFGDETEQQVSTNGSLNPKKIGQSKTRNAESVMKPDARLERETHKLAH